MHITSRFKAIIRNMSELDERLHLKMFFTAELIPFMLRSEETKKNHKAGVF